MLAIIRIILLAIGFFIISIWASLYSLLRPFHPNNVHFSARALGKLAKIIGLDVEVRIPFDVNALGPVVYIGNHQNSYDVFTMSHAVQPNTVSVGKKSLKWIPFFGQMYWLTGNILIDRKNTNKAMDTITITADKIKSKGLSVWLFPEGTRSYGRGLLPFKTGAFRTAAKAEVPIVPVCASNTHEQVDLNRWNNGKMIIEFLPPVYIKDESREGIRHFSNAVHASMLAKIIELSKESGHEFIPSPKKKENK